MKYILLFIVFLVSFAIVFAILRDNNKEEKQGEVRPADDPWESWFEEHKKGGCPECNRPDGMCMEAYEKLMEVIQQLKDSGYVPDFPHPLFPESYKKHH
jgi:hypothetical protein